jgi:putative nucleotidyltransferase with HDIG domain
MVAEIAMAISVQTRMFQATEHMALLRQLWRHSVATGSFAKEIARARRRNVESAFLCGLLHDIGKPLVLDAVTEIERARGTRYGQVALGAAMDQFHARVGALLSREWALPDQVSEAILFHHDYQEAPRFSEAAMMVNLADHVAHLVLPQTSGPGGRKVDEDTVRSLEVVAELNLYADDLDQLLHKGEKVARLVEAMT